MSLSEQSNPWKYFTPYQTLLVRRLMDGQSQQVEELKAQVKRLQEELAGVTTAKVLSPSPWLEILEQERLKALITELCEALEEEFGPVGYRAALKDKHPWNLIRRARDAVSVSKGEAAK